MRNKNISARRSNKRALKIVLWTVFALVVLAGAAYASWYFLINPETRAADKKLYSFTFKVIEWRYFAEEQPNSISERYAEDAWNGKGQWQGRKEVTLRDALDAGHARLRRGENVFRGKSPDQFRLVKQEITKQYEVEIPKGKEWYSLGIFADNGWNDSHRLAKPGAMLSNCFKKGHPAYNKYSVGLTFYQVVPLGEYKDRVELKTSMSHWDSYDYRGGSVPRSYPGSNGTFYSLGSSVHARYTGRGAYSTKANSGGETAEILKAYRIVKTEANNKEFYDSEYSFSAVDPNYYGFSHETDDMHLLERALRDSIKSEKIVFEFKAKDNSEDLQKGRGLYLLSELAISGYGGQRGLDEYAWMGWPDNQEGNLRRNEIAYLSPEVIALRDQRGNGDPGVFVKPNYFESKLSYSDYDNLKRDYRKKFYDWQLYGDITKGARKFRVGRESTKKVVEGYTIYPVVMGAPGDANPGNNVRVFWAVKLKDGGSYKKTYDYNADVAYRKWLSKVYFATEQGKREVLNIQENYKERFGKGLSIKDAMVLARNTYSNLVNYRSLFSVATVREMSVKDRFFYAEGKKLDVASAEVFSDPVSKFHSFPYFKKDTRREHGYPEKLYPNQWKYEGKYKGHKAELADGNVKISWLYKNTFQPKAYRIYRSLDQNFEPVGFGKKTGVNQIAKIEGGSEAFKNREYVDVQAPMDGNDSYWYRIQAVYPGDQATPWTKAFKAVSDIPPRGKEAPPKGEKPLKPSGVDAFGLPETIELTWKPGATSESVPGGGSSEGEGVKESEGVKSEGTKSTESQEVQGEAVTKGIGKLGSRTFDVYRTTIDPAPKGEQAEKAKKAEVSFFLDKFVNPAFAVVAQPVTQGNWEKVKSNVRTMTKDGKKYIFEDKGLKNGKEYWYRVIEVNQYGQSSASDYDMDIPHKHQDVNKDGFVNWVDVTRVLIYPAQLGRKVTNRDVTEDVNDDWVVDWTDIYGSATKRGILKYPTFPEIINAAKAQPGGGGGSAQD